MILYILAFLIGLVYGYVKPGKEDRIALLKKGIIYGIIIGIVFGLIMFLAATYLGGFGAGLLFFAGGIIVIFISVVVLVIIFIIGTFIGDLLEAALKKPT